MKPRGPILWLIPGAAAGLSIPALKLAIDEVTGHPVPELNPLFVGAICSNDRIVWKTQALCATVRPG